MGVRKLVGGGGGRAECKRFRIKVVFGLSVFVPPP